MSLRDFDGDEEQLDQDNPSNDSEASETESSMSWPLRSIGSDWSYFSGYTGDEDDSKDTEISSLSAYSAEVADAAADGEGVNQEEHNSVVSAEAGPNAFQAGHDHTYAKETVVTNTGPRGIRKRKQEDTAVSEAEVPPCKSVKLEEVDGDAGPSGIDIRREAQEANLLNEKMEKVKQEPVDSKPDERGIKREQEDAAPDTEEAPKCESAKREEVDVEAGPSGINIKKEDVPDAEAGPSGFQGPGYDSDRTYVSSGEEYPPDENCCCGCWPEMLRAIMFKNFIQHVNEMIREKMLMVEPVNILRRERGIKREQQEEAAPGSPERKRAKLEAVVDPCAIDVKKEYATDAEAGPSGLQQVVPKDVESDLSSGAEHSPRGSQFSILSTAKDTEPEAPRKTRKRLRRKRSRRDQAADSTDSEDGLTEPENS